MRIKLNKKMIEKLYEKNFGSSNIRPNCLEVCMQHLREILQNIMWEFFVLLQAISGKKSKLRKLPQQDSSKVYQELSIPKNIVLS